MNSVIIVTGISFVLSILIIIVNVIFKVNENLNKEKMLELLPGYNCGACGYGSCEAMSEALLKNGDNLSKCKIIKGENKKKLKKLLK